MRNLVIILALLPLLFVSASSAAGDDSAEWELLFEKEGIRSYRRTPEDSKLHEFRGEGEIPVNAYLVLAVVRQTDRAVEWVADMIEGYSLGYRRPDVELVYTHFDLAWPTRDRDYLYEESLHYDADQKTFTVSMVSTTDPKMPPREEAIRAELFWSEYSVTWIDETKCWATVRIHTDPKGSLPIALVNLVTKKWPWTTLSNLSRQSQMATGYEAEEAELRARFPIN